MERRKKLPLSSPRPSVVHTVRWGKSFSYCRWCLLTIVFAQGQKKQLTVIRLIMKNTIEHEIYERHAKAMAEAAAKAKQDPKYTSTTSSISSSSSSSISVPTEDNGNAEEESKPKKVKKAEKPNESSSGDEDGSGSDGDGDGDDDDDEEKMDVETNNTAAKAKESKSDWRNDPSIDFGNLAKHTVAQLRTYVYKHNLPIRARKKERLIKAILHHRNMKSWMTSSLSPAWWLHGLRFNEMKRNAFPK